MASNRGSEQQTVTWTKIPIVGLEAFKCDVRVNRDGRALDRHGEPLPFGVRLFKCGQDGVWLLGRQPLCETHARETALLMDDDIDEILAAWKAECL